MNKPQHWSNCDYRIKEYINGFINLLKYNLRENLKGIYLHGSLAMGCYYYPKSDIDVIAVVYSDLPPEHASALNYSIAQYSEVRPIFGSIEFSLINAEMAKTVPSRIKYILHYSSSWHERILNGRVSYSNDMTDLDLSAHLSVLKRRGICLYGEKIDSTFGDVKWSDYVFAVADDLKWILEEENICESPYYGILNICRAVQMLTENNGLCLSKDEGGNWGLTHFPLQYQGLIQQALDAYHSDAYPQNEYERKTGVLTWNSHELLIFRDYIKSSYMKLQY